MPIINKVYERIYYEPWGYKRSVLSDNVASMEAIELIMKRDDKTKLHYHEKVTEIFYIVSGEMMFLIDDKEYHLSEGDFIAIKPGEKHKIIPKTNGKIFIVKTPPDEGDRHFLE
jgi:mannose-6-phosphate isomerase-like protein (cupin superfamily)